MGVTGGSVSCRNMTKRGGAEGVFFGAKGVKTCEFFETSRSYPQVGALSLHGPRDRFSLKQTRRERTHHEHHRRHHTTSRTPPAPD